MNVALLQVETNFCICDSIVVNVVLLRPLVVKYQVLVRTGELTGADTDANVYVVLYGERGDTGRRRLVYSDNPVKFREGQVH